MLNAEQQKAFDLMKSGANVHLYGEAGTGKSYVIKEFLNSLSYDERLNTLVTAPTGIAALNIGGVTLHRTFKAPIEPISPHDIPAPKSLDVIKNADRIIIDEISMCRFDLFEYVTKCIHLAEEASKKKIQVIVIGDFLQLPPVITEKDRVALNELWDKKDIGNGYAFQAPLWKSYNFKNIGLKTIVRQAEKDLAENENKARKGDTSSIYWFKYNTAKRRIKNAITLVSSNDEAKEINKEEIEKLNGGIFFEADIDGKVNKSEYPTYPKLQICKDMRVMLIINHSKYDLRNGELGTVTDIKLDKVTISFDSGTEAEIETYRFEFFNYEVKSSSGGKKYIEKTCIGTFEQLPLKPAYAITIHKSQGQTFDKVNLQANNCFAPGQLYVGLSRCKTAKNLYIKGLKESSLITSQDALDFYTSLDDCVTKPKSRGGARAGAGRKNKYVSETIIMRVPAVAKSEIEELCKKYEVMK